MEKSELFPAFLVLVIPEVGIAFLGFSVGLRTLGSAVSLSEGQGQLQPALDVAPPTVLVVDSATQGVRRRAPNDLKGSTSDPSASQVWLYPKF